MSTALQRSNPLIDFLSGPQLYIHHHTLCRVIRHLAPLKHLATFSCVHHWCSRAKAVPSRVRRAAMHTHLWQDGRSACLQTWQQEP